MRAHGRAAVWTLTGTVVLLGGILAPSVARGEGSPRPSFRTTVQSADGRLAIDIPDGALPAGSEVSATFHDAADIPPEAVGLGTDGFYRLEPSGVTFSEPVRVSRRYTAEELGIDVPTTGLPIMVGAIRAPDGTWSWFDDPRETYDLDDGSITVSGTTRHFSDAYYPRPETALEAAALFLGATDVDVDDFTLMGVIGRAVGLGMGPPAVPTDPARGAIAMTPANDQPPWPDWISPGELGFEAALLHRLFYCEGLGHGRLAIAALMAATPAQEAPVESVLDDLGLAGPSTTVEVGGSVSCQEPPPTTPRCVSAEIQDSRFHDFKSKPFPDRLVLTLVFPEEMAGGSVTVALTGANGDEPVTADIDAHGRATLVMGMKRKAHVQLTNVSVTPPASDAATDITAEVVLWPELALAPGVQEASYGQCP